MSLIFPAPGQLWKHYKSNQYRIFGVSHGGECPDCNCVTKFNAKHTDDKRIIEVVVATNFREGYWLYDPLNQAWLSKPHVIYGAKPNSQHWVREIGEFMEVLPDGTQRFQYKGVAEVNMSELESIA